MSEILISGTERRFAIDHNDGSFFDEPWLMDYKSGKEYRYDKIPPRIKRAFARELKARGRMNPEEASLVLSFVIHG